MTIPSETELRRFFDDESVAREAYRVGVTTSWLSLRIVDHLYREGSATTGDVARGLNMDMRDVRDRLDQLEEVDVVARHDDEWNVIADEITISITNADGVDLSLSTGEPDAGEPDASGADAEDTEGEVGSLQSIVRRLSGWLRR
jgi:hypothetical protein